MLTLSQFANIIETQIKDQVIPVLDNVQIKQSQYNKSTGPVVGLMVSNPKVPGVTMAFDLSDAYNRYIFAETDAQHDFIIDVVAQMRMNILNNFQELSKKAEATAKVLDYKWVKEHLTLRLLPDYSPYASDSPAKVIGGDMMLVAQVRFNEHETTVISNKLLEEYGITKDQLFEDAIANALDKEPAVIQSLGDIVGEKTPFPTYIVTNNLTGNLGAAAIAYPNVLDEVASKIGGNFYLIPTSIHECMAVPTEHADPKELNNIIDEANCSLRPGEILSTHCYFYDAVEKSLTNPINRDPRHEIYNFDYPDDELEDDIDEDIDDDIDL